MCQCGDATLDCEQQVKEDLAVSTQYSLPAVFLTHGVVEVYIQAFLISIVDGIQPQT